MENLIFSVIPLYTERLNLYFIYLSGVAELGEVGFKILLFYSVSCQRYFVHLLLQQTSWRKQWGKKGGCFIFYRALKPPSALDTLSMRIIQVFLYGVRHCLHLPTLTNIQSLRDIYETYKCAVL